MTHRLVSDHSGATVSTSLRVSDAALSDSQILSDAWLDLRWVRAARLVHVGAAWLAAGIAVVILLARHVEAVGEVLPGPWRLMTSSTALSMLLLAVSLLVFRRMVPVTATLLVGTAVLAGSAVLVHLGSVDASLLQWLLIDSQSPPGFGLMSAQTAGWVVLACATVALGLARRQQAMTSTIGVVLLAVTLTFLAFRTLGQTSLIGQSKAVILSFPTATCMGLLAASWAALWTLHGSWKGVLERGVAAAALRWSLIGTTVMAVLATTALTILLGNESVEPATALALVLAVTLVALMAAAMLLFRVISPVEHELRRIALLDGPTGLLNQSAFMEVAPRLLSEAHREGRAVAVVMFDLDGLKQVNDTYGHLHGTELIGHFGQALAAATRSSDMAARVGGDEFVVLLRVNQDVDGLEMLIAALIERIDDRLAALSTESPRPWTISYSWGSAVETLSQEDLTGLLARADDELYRNKNGDQRR